jgi:hypothetical protein
MPYIVGATPSRGKRTYFNRHYRAKTRVEAKAYPFPKKTIAARRAEKLEAKGYGNVQVINCNGWGRPAKKRTVRRGR